MKLRLSFVRLSSVGMGPALLLALLLAAPASGEASGAPVEPAGLEEALAGPQGPLLLDVRTPAEYEEGFVPGATLVPVQELPERLGELEAWRDRGVVVYCESGRRAEQAAALLREAGFRDVRLLEGSMRRWRAEERPTEEPGAEPSPGS